MTIEQEIQKAVRDWQAGRRAEALATCRQVLVQPVRDPQVFNSLGANLAGAGMIDLAIEFFAKAELLNPGNPDFPNNVGFCLNVLGRRAEAVAAFGRALRLNPNYTDAFYNLGVTRQTQGDFADAVTAYKRATELRPTHAEAFGNMGVALRELGQVELAIEAMQKALQIKPAYPFALNNLANILREMGRPDESIAACMKAIQIDPNYSSPYTNLGNALKEQGRLDEAEKAYLRAVELSPGEPALLSNLLLAMHFQPKYDATAIRQAHLEFDRRFGQPLRPRFRPHANSRDPDRRLRVGYVSADLKSHPVGRFLLPLLQEHDRTRFEVFCYSGTELTDFFTDRLRCCADVWRDITHLNDGQAAELIRQDQIDVLVDLTMHTAGRLPVFALKPAPVQLSYLAYCSTTGLDTIEYRLTDPHIDPPGRGDADYLEQSIRLAETYFCYVPHLPTPDPGPLPAIASGVVTLACLNNFCKVTAESIKIWCSILRAVPNSRLLLHAREGSHRQRVRDQLVHESVDPQRLSFVEFIPPEDYFAAHLNIDIALDPFPCNGGTTTCDALWMGVPVVTLVGRTAVGRVGKSILSNAGLPELIAETLEQYAYIAAGLARDLPRLATVRSMLRQRMLGSPLTDAPRFAVHAEAALRDAWLRWLAR